MKWKHAGAAMILAMAAGCSPAATPPAVDANAAASTVTPDASKVADEVKAAIAVQVQAYATRDIEAMLSVMAPDYVWITYGQPNATGAAVRTGVEAQFADPALKLTVADETVDVAQAGDMAVYHSTYTYTYTDATTKAPVTEPGNWVAIFKRQPDGSMKLARDLIVALPASK
ncbi:MAG TPA: nuclear transport factor 2 family protein [Hyphomonadaceae bacterium]|nr:nuclear transport factor 2 family protein [Hyphomonadaceae bacterium]HPN05578.1 nuclear transport factor 2 family protein [Hyphomonadaceae bacterium]